MKVYVESSDQIVERKADDRGRITLGNEYSGKEVQVAILDVEDGDVDE